MHGGWLCVPNISVVLLGLRGAHNVPRKGDAGAESAGFSAILPLLDAGDVALVVARRVEVAVAVVGAVLVLLVLVGS
jgi:hypothetical protein